MSTLVFLFIFSFATLFSAQENKSQRTIHSAFQWIEKCSRIETDEDAAPLITLIQNNNLNINEPLYYFHNTKHPSFTMLGLTVHEHKNWLILPLIVAGALVNDSSSKKPTPLHIAIEAHNLPAAEMLITKYNADIEATAQYPRRGTALQTLLHQKFDYSIQTGSPLPLLQLLLKKKASLRNEDIDKECDQTVVELCLEHGNFPMIPPLVKAGARIDRSQKISSLMWALKDNSVANKEEAIRSLLTCGANPHMHDEEYGTTFVKAINDDLQYSSIKELYNEIVPQNDLSENGTHEIIEYLI